MTISGVRDNVHALLQASDKFVTVLAHEPSEDSPFAGYPSVAHYYVDAESNFATVSQNRRVLEYVIEIYMVTNAATSADNEFKEAYALLDSTMQMFDESIDLSSPTIPLARACDIMRPTPSTLSRINLPEGPGFVANIRLFCESDITFRNS